MADKGRARTCALSAAAQGVVRVRHIGRRVRIADLVVAGDVKDVAAKHSTCFSQHHCLLQTSMLSEARC